MSNLQMFQDEKGKLSPQTVNQPFFSMFLDGLKKDSKVEKTTLLTVAETVASQEKKAGFLTWAQINSAKKVKAALVKWAGDENYTLPLTKSATGGRGLEQMPLEVTSYMSLGNDSNARFRGFFSYENDNNETVIWGSWDHTTAPKLLSDVLMADAKALGATVTDVKEKDGNKEYLSVRKFSVPSSGRRPQIDFMVDYRSGSFGKRVIIMLNGTKKVTEDIEVTEKAHE